MRRAIRVRLEIRRAGGAAVRPPCQSTATRRGFGPWGAAEISGPVGPARSGSCVGRLGFATRIWTRLRHTVTAEHGASPAREVRRARKKSGPTPLYSKRTRVGKTRCGMTSKYNKNGRSAAGGVSPRACIPDSDRLRLVTLQGTPHPKSRG